MPGVTLVVPDTFRNYAALVQRRVDMAIRDATEAMCVAIIKQTPIDTDDGRDEIVMRGDWVSGIGDVPSDVNRGDLSGGEAKEQVRSVVRKWTPHTGRPFLFANHKRYGVMLEYGLYPQPGGSRTRNGFSTQAPAGMVRINTAEFPDHLKVGATKAQGIK